MAEPKGTRFDLEEAPQEWLAWAIWQGESHRLGLSLAQVTGWFDEFHDYWVGVPGQRGRKLDWLATWRNHVRREINREVDRQRRFGPRARQESGIGLGASAAARARDRENGRGH